MRAARPARPASSSPPTASTNWRPAPNTWSESSSPTPTWPPASPRSAAPSPPPSQRVAALKARVDSYNERLAAARTEVATRPRKRRGGRRRTCTPSPPLARRRWPPSKTRSANGPATSRPPRRPKPNASAPQKPKRSRTLARRPLLDPRLHRDVRVRRQLRRPQPFIGRRRRLPDPPLDLGALRRPGRAPERSQGRTRQDRRRNLGRLRPKCLGLRLSGDPGRGGASCTFSAIPCGASKRVSTEKVKRNPFRDRRPPNTHGSCAEDAQNRPCHLTRLA